MMLNEAALLQPDDPCFRVSGACFPRKAVLVCMQRQELCEAAPELERDLRERALLWKAALRPENLCSTLGAAGGH